MSVVPRLLTSADEYLINIRDVEPQLDRMDSPGASVLRRFLQPDAAGVPGRHLAGRAPDVLNGIVQQVKSRFRKVAALGGAAASARLRDPEA